MLACGIVLIVIGGLGILLGLFMFNTIGIACLVGASGSLVAGIGLVLGNRKIKKMMR